MNEYEAALYWIRINPNDTKSNNIEMLYNLFNRVVPNMSNYYFPAEVAMALLELGETVENFPYYEGYNCNRIEEFYCVIDELFAMRNKGIINNAQLKYIIELGEPKAILHFMKNEIADLNKWLTIRIGFALEYADCSKSNKKIIKVWLNNHNWKLGGISEFYEITSNYLGEFKIHVYEDSITNFNKLGEHECFEERPGYYHVFRSVI